MHVMMYVALSRMEDTTQVMRYCTHCNTVPIHTTFMLHAPHCVGHPVASHKAPPAPCSKHPSQHASGCGRLREQGCNLHTLLDQVNTCENKAGQQLCDKPRGQVLRQRGGEGWQHTLADEFVAEKVGGGGWDRHGCDGGKAAIQGSCTLLAQDLSTVATE